MGRYSKDVVNESKVAKARGDHIRCHYKHCREIGEAIKGRTVKNAKAYLENVLLYKEAIPITKYTGGGGRHAQAKQLKVSGDRVQWPQKATKVFLGLLTNIQSNATVKGLDLDKIKITHANSNQAPKMHRRTYRAHGRVNNFNSSPAHIQLIAEEAADEIVKEADAVERKMSRKQAAQARSKKIPVGGGN